MKIVIDTNMIMADLIKDGISRKIIFNKNFYFITPENTLSEIYKYEELIIRKAKINHEIFEILLALIFENIETIPKEEYKDFLEQAKHLIEDVDDVPFIAVGLSSKAEGIWSNDSHFLKQGKIKIFKTINMLGFI